jgi:spermidine synthase
VQPLETLGNVTTPDGKELVLYRRSGHFHLRVDGLELMSSRPQGSEEVLAELACEGLRGAPRVLIGGLGMGYTLRAALDLLPPRARVEVAEVFPAVVEWNRGPLAPLAGRPLDDPRVEVFAADVGARLESGGTYDVILLDVDNGPDAFTLGSNADLYGDAGLARIYRHLLAAGVLAVWSADPSRAFVQRLRKAGFAPRSVTVPARRTRGPNHTIFVARRRR